MFRLLRVWRSPLKLDSSLVNLPASVCHCCEVFRNAVTESEQQLLWDELSSLIAKDGETTYVPSKMDSKQVRNVALDLFGFEKFTEMKDYRKMATKKVPGIPFSPTLYTFVQGPAAQLLKGTAPDTARIIEHHAPGYEMHVESPTIGSQFLYLSLIAPTVVHFDNEASNEKGEVFLPPRSIMLVSGELRWGWRFGERFESTHTFRSRKIPAEYRLSIQLCKFAPGMVDRKKLTNMAKKSVDTALSDSINANEEKAKEVQQSLLQNPVSLPEKQEDESKGKGKLGGDYVPKKLPSAEERAGQYQQYRSDMKRFNDVVGDMEEKQKRGVDVSPAWLREKFQMRSGEGPDEHGFDLDDPAASALAIEAKVRHFKEKFEAMKYTDEVALKKKDEGNASNKKKASGSFDKHFDMVETYAKKIGLQREFDRNKIEQVYKKLPSSLPGLPEVPGSDLNIEVPEETAADKK